MKRLLLSPLTIALAVAASSSHLAMAAGPIDGELYGKINLSLDYVDIDDETPANDDQDQWELNSNASRIGIKGKSELSPSLKAIYQLEWQVTADGDGNDLTARNRFVGLESSEFGTVIGGKHDTPVKLAQNKVDQFNDLPGDITNTFEGENRPNDIVMYTTPKFGPVTVLGAFIPGEGVDSNDGLADGISVSVNFESGDLYGAVGFETEVDGQDLIRLVGQYKLNDLLFGAMVQKNENEANTVDELGFLVSVAMKVGDITFKAQTGFVDNDGVQPYPVDLDDYEREDQYFTKQSTHSIGADYKLGKNTMAFAFLTFNSDEADNGDKLDEQVLGVGLEHKF